ncbi:adenylate/guanylate cyclase domain-containing protein [Oscillatoria sp. CS-180]|uniref:adenylate/guanylate cyclase domain-containing protein n=1 Tax=Oscillatoria sp. CS-180 TaxID=3021720 RepID=UPI00232EBCF8|nr:adenylate/guanylate cyclase domain-containing protein [Oscillatoria sp. CS-180]MDB9527277.1 adenylate/guanylate cyclase domain-containing protein [Oscillatoria sp. CS-180]
MASILQSSMGLLRSRLSRRIVTWVFLSIIAIEAIIFIPSFYRRYQEKLDELSDLSSEVLLTVKASIMLGDNSIGLLNIIQQNLKPDSVIRGAVLCLSNGEVVESFGETPVIDCAAVSPGATVTELSSDRQRYDVAWPSDRLSDQYILIVRHDASGVMSEMRQYALAIGGLVIIISVFVTFVTIVVLERILIIPVLRLRDDLKQARDAVGQAQPPNFQTQAMKRRDELGEVSKAFYELFERVHREISDRKQAEMALKVEQEKSEKLLLNILPITIAEQLKMEVGAIASRFEEATILFADIVDFTGLSTQMSPNELVCLLNEVFSAFDCIAESLGLEKIKTIGDAYMVVGGLPNPQPDHAQATLEMAIKMQETIQSFKRADGSPFRLRIGINTGPVVAGVIGIKKFSYDLWGDAVNIASRMESHGIDDRIQVSKSTYDRLKTRYDFEDRGPIKIKGRGYMQTYILKERQTAVLKAEGTKKRLNEDIL